MVITENETLEIKNVLSFRKKMTQKEIGEYGKQIERVILENGAYRNGPLVTATFSVEKGVDGVQAVDMEFLIPLDRTIDKNNLPDGYDFKPDIFITNAVRLKHTGHPAKLRLSINELNNYITEHKLVPITVGYNVTVRESKMSLEMDQTEVDVYVGISPNRL